MKVKISKVAFAFMLIVNFSFIGHDSSRVHNAQEQEIVGYLVSENLSSKIIGIGESAHGVKQFASFRASFAKEMIKKKQLKLILIETSYADALKLNEYIHGNDSIKINQANLTNFVYGIWATDDFLNLIEWLKAYNKTVHHEEAISVFGIDSQYAIHAVEFLERYQKKYPQINFFSKEEKELLLKLKPAANFNIKRLSDEEQQLATNIYDRYTNKDFLSQIPETEIYFLLKNVAYSIAYQKASVLNFLNMRDEHMAAFVEALSDAYLVDKSALLWAHNGHLIKSRTMVRKTMGYFLNRSFKSDYSLIMLDFNKGNYLDANTREARHVDALPENLSFFGWHSEDSIQLIDPSLKTGYIRNIGDGAGLKKVKFGKDFNYLVYYDNVSSIGN